MPETLADRVHTLVTAPGSKELVATFYDETKPFAGSLFDNLGENPPDQIIADDLLAVTLLDVGFMPRAVRTLLEQGRPDGQIGRLLAEHRVPPNVDLWDASDEVLDGALNVWNKIKEQSRKGVMAGIGPTKRSKLLARKRPRLIPIVDSVVRDALGPLLGDDSWTALREALGDEGLRKDIGSLRPAEGGDGVTTLRLLDSVVWMWCSKGKAARKARARLDHPLGRWRT